MKLFIVSLLLLMIGCVSPYRYFPEEPNWMANDNVILYTNNTYVVTEELIYNYTYQKLYLKEINTWRIHNKVP